MMVLNSNDNYNNINIAKLQAEVRKWQTKKIIIDETRKEFEEIYKEIFKDKNQTITWERKNICLPTFNKKCLKKKKTKTDKDNILKNKLLSDAVTRCNNEDSLPSSQKSALPCSQKSLELISVDIPAEVISESTKAKEAKDISSKTLHINNTVNRGSDNLKVIDNLKEINIQETRNKPDCFASTSVNISNETTESRNNLNEVNVLSSNFSQLNTTSDFDMTCVSSVIDDSTLVKTSSLWDSFNGDLTLENKPKLSESEVDSLNERRNQILMEIAWLDQAIDSRKQYILMKNQTLI